MPLHRAHSDWQAGRIDKTEYIAQMHAGHATLFEYPELLATSSIERVELTSEGVVFVSRRGLRFSCAAADQRAAPIEAINFGSYESDDERLFESLLRPGQTIVDIGAHIGWYSIHAAAAHPTSRVLAIEPMPASAHLLLRNVAMNRLQNIEVIETACSDTVGWTQLYVPEHWPTASSTADILAAGHSIRVSMSRLDDIITERQLNVDVIKVDVEGGEWSVLHGAESILRHHRPAVFCELLRKWSACHGRHPNDLLDWMAQLGYHCEFLGPAGLTPLTKMTDDITATNFLFRHDFCRLT